MVPPVRINAIRGKLAMLTVPFSVTEVGIFGE
jgi:hypothetical protein